MLSYEKFRLNNMKGETRICKIEGHCLSTDEKPVDGIANGSCLYEIDTSKVFVFDEENAQWREWTNAQTAAAMVIKNALTYPKSPTTD